MTENPIELRFGFDRKLFPRALMAFWQSAVPRPNFINRVIVWAVIWGLLLMATLVLAALGVGPIFVGAGLVGAGVLVIGFVVLQRVRMRRFFRVIGGHWDKAGITQAAFGPQNVTLRDDVSQSTLSWGAIDAIVGVRGGTVIRTGVSMVAIPDTCLPEGLSPKAFRAQLELWWTAP